MNKKLVTDTMLNGLKEVKLSDKQLKELVQTVSKGIDQCLENKKSDRKSCIKAVDMVYTSAGVAKPSVVLGPYNCTAEIAMVYAYISKRLNEVEEIDSDDLFKECQFTQEQFRDMWKTRFDADAKTPVQAMSSGLSNIVYGAHESAWLAYYEFFAKHYKLDKTPVQGLSALSKVCGWLLPMSDIAIVCHRPKAMYLDDNNRLHNTDGPAIEFYGDLHVSDVYAVHGVTVSKSVIDRTFTLADINKESNDEVRRLLIDFYGTGRYIEESGLTPVQSDRFGELYTKQIPNHEQPLVVVKFTNATPEADGTRKVYWRRVDPLAYGGVDTAHKAAASCWRKADGSLLYANHEDYNPAQES